MISIPQPKYLIHISNLYLVYFTTNGLSQLLRAPSATDSFLGLSSPQVECRHMIPVSHAHSQVLRRFWEVVIYTPSYSCIAPTMGACANFELN
jgi:hypothetical protein